MRAFFREAWRKQKEGVPMEPMEALIADVVALHPEYHALLENPIKDLDQDFLPEHGQTNPFLHMGMHIALREQYMTNRPSGITSLYKKMIKQCGDPHVAEHEMMDCLGEALFQAQRDGMPPDESRYLDCLQNLLKK